MNQFQVTDGDWGSWFTPNQPSWLFADGSGNATVRIDLNTYNDGWVVATNRISTTVDPTARNAVGAWNGWNNADPTAVMTALDGGIYELQTVIASAGDWGFKATQSGRWNYKVAADDANVNVSVMEVVATVPNQPINMFVNVLNGTISVNVLPVPEPATLALLGLSGLVAVRRLGLRRK